MYELTSMNELREKSVLLTGYLEFIIDHYFLESSESRTTNVSCEILTPRDPEKRGCQLSLKFSKDINLVFQQLIKRGVVVSKIFGCYLVLFNKCGVGRPDGRMV